MRREGMIRENPSYKQNLIFKEVFGGNREEADYSPKYQEIFNRQEAAADSDNNILALFLIWTTQFVKYD